LTGRVLLVGVGVQWRLLVEFVVAIGYGVLFSVCRSSTPRSKVRGGHLRGHPVDRRAVIVVVVNQRYLDAAITQLAGTRHASEPATKNQHPFIPVHSDSSRDRRSRELRQPLVEDDPCRRLDERKMGERLRKVAEVSTGVDVELLGEESKRRGDS
jgi:hypothetical protein